jgi:hypothetical protein
VVVLDEHVVQITSAPAKIAGGHLETKPITIMELESGRVAQLGEHLLCKQGVTGSNPVTSTNHLKINHLRQSCFMVSVIFGIWEQ